jgi:hypothetical protein
VRLQIKPGLRQAWRGPGTVQIGLDARRGTVLDGLTAADRALLEALGDGATAGPDDRSRQLVRLLAEAGVLVDRRAGRAALTRLGPARQRLEPDAQIWSVVHPGSGDGWELLAARSRRRVDVVGAGRTGSALAATLVAAGVGRVSVEDPLPVGPGDVVPGGAGITDVGRTRELASRQAAERIGGPAGSVAAVPGEGGPAAPADLVVLVEPAVADVTVADRLLAADVAHLSVVIGEAGATVGPLVLPGRGPCLRCLELHRCDRDPGWPQVLAQLLTGRDRAAPEETACAGLTAALAALQVLALLDGVRAPAALGATLEIELPDGLVSRREWPAHQACGCHWPPRPPEAHRTRRVDLPGASGPTAGRMPV